jgi:serine/threonine protein kinase
MSGEPLGPSAPEYVVDMPDLSNMSSSLVKHEIRIIDFDQSFNTNRPPEHMLHTPKRFLAPEAIFDLTPGIASDIWALGCIIFRMRAGGDLFGSYGTGSPSDAVEQIIKTIGPLPDKWRHVKFDYDEGFPIRSEAEEREKECATIDWPLTYPLKACIDDIEDDPSDPIPSDLTALLPAVRNDDELFWNPPPSPGTRCRDDYGILHNTEGYADMPHISSEEADCLYDLLSRIFRYEPEERISLEEIIKHPWITGDFD